MDAGKFGETILKRALGKTLSARNRPRPTLPISCAFNAHRERGRLAEAASQVWGRSHRGTPASYLLKCRCKGDQPRRRSILLEVLQPNHLSEIVDFPLHLNCGVRKRAAANSKRLRGRYVF